MSFQDIADQYFNQLDEIKKRPILQEKYFLIGVLYSVMLWFLIPITKNLLNSDSVTLSGVEGIGYLSLIFISPALIIFPIIFGGTHIIMDLLVKKDEAVQMQLTSLDEKYEAKRKSYNKLVIVSLIVIALFTIGAFWYKDLLMDSTLSDVQMAALLFIPCLLLSLALGIYSKRRAQIVLFNQYEKRLLAALEENVRKGKETAQ